MKKKQLVDKVTKQFNVKPGKARSAVDLVLKELLAASDSKEGFSSSILNIKVSDRAQASTDSPQTESSARRTATMHAANSYATPAVQQ